MRTIFSLASLLLCGFFAGAAPILAAEPGRPQSPWSADEAAIRALPEQSGWFTLVWVRTLAGWRVLHDHSRAERILG